MVKKLPVSTQTFAKIINGGYLYFDKTQYIYRLIEGECYFFARPRRFGKSLLCSTLKSLFNGHKHLFKGLWIAEHTDYAWPEYPVVHIDFLGIADISPKELQSSLMRYLDDIAQSYDLAPLAFTTPKEMLRKLVLQLAQKTGTGVVLLIDEYDKPILEHLHNESVAKEMRSILRSFYEVIKSLDDHLRFVFITGVSRFSQTSIFSGLNQMLDVSMDPDFAYLVGCTEQELIHCASEHLEVMALNKKTSVALLIDDLRTFYDGYRFWKNVPVRQFEAGLEPERIFNPFSVVNALHSHQFDNYWFKSGTPTFLIRLLKQQHYPVESLEALKADLSELETFELDHLPLTTLLYQTGYLTIKMYDPLTKNFTLTFPNREVQEAFLSNILKLIGEFQINQINDYTKDLLDDLNQRNIAHFINRLKTFYALIPYGIHLDREKYYQTIFFVVMKLLGAHIVVELETNVGRIDAVIETKDCLYIIEFKLNKKASVALEQIKTNKYVQRYLGDPRDIMLVGIAFDATEKNISDSVIQVFDKKTVM